MNNINSQNQNFKTIFKISQNNKTLKTLSNFSFSDFSLSEYDFDEDLNSIKPINKPINYLRDNSKKMEYSKNWGEKHNIKQLRESLDCTKNCFFDYNKIDVLHLKKRFLDLSEMIENYEIDKKPIFSKILNDNSNFTNKVKLISSLFFFYFKIKNLLKEIKKELKIKKIDSIPKSLNTASLKDLAYGNTILNQLFLQINQIFINFDKINVLNNYFNFFVKNLICQKIDVLFFILNENFMKEEFKGKSLFKFEIFNRMIELNIQCESSNQGKNNIINEIIMKKKFKSENMFDNQIKMKSKIELSDESIDQEFDVDFSKNIKEMKYFPKQKFVKPIKIKQFKDSNLEFD